MKLAELGETSRQVAEVSGRLEKIKLMAELLARVPPDEIEIAVSYLSGSIRQQRTGIGWAALQAAMPERPTESPTIELAEVDATFKRIAGVAAGKGSGGERQRLLGELLARATNDEQDFLFRLVTGELRQGAVEGLMLEAVARAAGVPAEGIRRARMMAGNLPGVARAALSGSGCSRSCSLAQLGTNRIFSFGL